MTFLLLGPLFFYTWIAITFGQNSHLVDLTYPILEESNQAVYKPGQKKYERLTDLETDTPDGLKFRIYSFRIDEHSGTHMDAPFHSYNTGWRVEQIPGENLVAIPGQLIDLSGQIINRGKPNTSYSIGVDDILKWEGKNGRISQRSVVLFRTGFGDYWPNAEKYTGREFTNGRKMSFPGLNVAAARFLGQRRVIGIGIDTLSLDNPATNSYAAHVELASRNIYILENLSNLKSLPPRGFDLWLMPLKVEGGSGAPVRIFAQIKTN